jgi:diaminohydroxyphosphoribosylaminopyrimidine deaminase/5-amino-6-(5-phosphoribosylamino)uracil reductase
MNPAGFMRVALRLAGRGYGATSPNPMVGAVLVKGEKIIGRGWHRRAGEPHAEIEALRDAERHGYNVKGATLYVTLEPCSTHGRTPPCTKAICESGIRKVIVGATDPNPKHAGAGFKLLKQAGVEVVSGVLTAECDGLNEAFNHWIVNRTPFVTVKAAMTLDGKIATASGESKWITGEKARAHGMKLRKGADAILVGINTVLADDPSLTVRVVQGRKSKVQSLGKAENRLRRIILDSNARTPLSSRVVADDSRQLTTIVVGPEAPRTRVAALAKKVRVLEAPVRKGCIDLKWLLKRLGAEEVASLLVEGGGQVNASFLLSRLAHRVAFFYAPKVLGGRAARKAVAGVGVRSAAEGLNLENVEWKNLGKDLLLTARIASV